MHPSRSANKGDAALEHTSVNEQQITEALQRVPQNRWREVLDFIGSLQAPAQGEVGPPPKTKDVPKKQWTAGELRKLPAELRDTILAEQAALLKAEYRNNPELTDFAAFGQDDLYVDSSN